MKAIAHQCIVCGHSLDGHHFNARLCSMACQLDHHNEQNRFYYAADIANQRAKTNAKNAEKRAARPPKGCLICGAALSKEIKNLKFCSEEHKRENRLRLRREKYANDPADRIAKNKWARLHRDRISELGKLRRAANPEKHNAYARAWQAANPEKVKRYKQKHKATHQDECHLQKRRDRDRNRREKNTAILLAVRELELV